MLLQKFRNISWKSGNGSVLMCLSMMMVALSIVTLLACRSVAFQESTFAQTRADVIADGTAEYSRTVLGNINKAKANKMCAQLITANELDDRDITVKMDESKFSSGDVEITLSGMLKSLFGGKEYSKIALTHVLMSAVIATEDTFPKNPLDLANPILTNSVSERSPENYYNVVNQFQVEKISRYKPKGGATYCNCYARDVFYAMGIPEEYGGAGGCGWMLYRLLSFDPKVTGWTKVTLEEAQEWANQGRPAVALWSEHVQVIMPSPSALGLPNDESSTKLYVSEAGAWSAIHSYIGIPKYKYTTEYLSTADPIPAYAGNPACFFVHQ